MSFDWWKDFRLPTQRHDRLRKIGYAQEKGVSPLEWVDWNVTIHHESIVSFGWVQRERNSFINLMITQGIHVFHSTTERVLETEKSGNQSFVCGPLLVNDWKTSISRLETNDVWISPPVALKLRRENLILRAKVREWLLWNSAIKIVLRKTLSIAGEHLHRSRKNTEAKFSMDNETLSECDFSYQLGAGTVTLRET